MALFFWFTSSQMKGKLNQRWLRLLSHLSMSLFPVGLFLLRSHSPAHMTESSPRVPSWLAMCPSLHLRLSLPTLLLNPVCSFSASCFFVSQDSPLSSTWSHEGGQETRNPKASLQLQHQPTEWLRMKKDIVLPLENTYFCSYFNCQSIWQAMSQHIHLTRWIGLGRYLVSEVLALQAQRHQFHPQNPYKKCFNS